MKEGTREFNNYIDNLCSRNILLFDDLGESKVSEWRMKHFTYIVNQRYYNGKVTFFNTMKTMVELNRDLGEHIISRICEMCKGYMVEVESKVDMRKQA